MGRRRSRYLLPVLLCLAYLAQCGWFIATQSFTVDEPTHILDGLTAWHRGVFEHEAHPPLANLLLTIPLRWGDWPAQGPQLFQQNLEELAWHVRPVNVLLGLILAILVWTTACRLFSEGAANFGLALFVFSPGLIAHFALATIDGPATISIFVVALQLVRWLRNSSLPQTALLGVALGASLVMKFYTIPLYALTIGLVLALKPRELVLNPWNWNWGKAVTAVLVSFLLVWAVYFFHVSKVTVHDGGATATVPGHPGPSTTAVKVPVNLTFYLPAGEYFMGAAYLFRLNRKGHPSFFLGEVSRTGGWKLYLPTVILLKWPTVVLVLFLITLILVLLSRLRLPGELALLSLFPTVFFSLAIFSKLNLGDRYILPVYPFLLTLTAGLWQVARHRRTTMLLAVAAVGLLAADSFRYAPDYLSYFNVFVRPGESWRLLTDSNLDWGQGLLALRKYQLQHPNEQIHLAYFGGLSGLGLLPSAYGIRYLPLHENDRASGTVVVSATHLSGQLLQNPSSYHWVLQYPRKAILNHTLQVFEIPVDRPPRQ